MPGIAGLIGSISKQEGLRRVREMLQAMTYEPFYSTGVYCNEELGVYAGWVVHPNSFCDCMPVKSADGRTILLLDGEVFNLTESGTFDASYLAQFYEERGESFFEELNGTFSGMVVNAAARSVKLFNDRMGFQKIYYVEDSQGLFYFSSEAKSLLRVVPSTRELDREGLAQFLTYGCTLGLKTLYKGVSLMPPAAIWELRPNTPAKKSTYFLPSDWQTDPCVDAHSFEENFRQIFRSILPRYFSGALPPGLSLTGGWDTRMIMACLRPEAGKLPCYTFAGLSGETVDVQFARRIARLAQQNHTVLNLQPDFLADFADLALLTVYASDGYGDACLSHEIYLNRKVRDICGVRVTGNFGSEILRGMSTFKEIGVRTDGFQELRTDIARVKEQWNHGGSETSPAASPAAFAIFNEIPWKHTATARLARSQLPVRAPFLDNEILKLACACPPSVPRDSAMAASLVKHECPELLSVATDRGESGQGGPLGAALKRFFYAGTFKLDYFLTEGTPDFISVIADMVPADSVLPVRHKYLEYRRWFRGPLRSYVEDVLGGNNAFVSGLLGRNGIDRTLRDNASGVRNELANLNALLTLELIDKSLLRIPTTPQRHAVVEISS